MLLLILLSTIFAVLSLNLYRSRRKNPKGPFPLPIIGNIHQLIFACWKAGGLVEAYNLFKKEYGKVFTLWLGPWPTVYISDFDVAHETHIKRANEFGVRFATGGMDLHTRGMGIILSNGDFWLEHRRFALHTLRNFGLGRNIMEDQIMEEFDFRFSEFRQSNFKNGAIEVKTMEFFEILVGSIINRMIFSDRFETGDKMFDKLRRDLAESHTSLSLFDAFCPKWILTSEWMRWRTTKTFAPMKSIMNMLEEKIRKRVEEVREGRHVLEEDARDFVDAFLWKIEKDRAMGEESTFNLDSLVIDVYDLWVAGQETTSITLTWACVCLLNHPEIVLETRNELLEVTCGSRPLSLSDRPRTIHLNAVINEVQRIASILNTNIFRVMQNDTLIDGQPLEAGAIFTTQLSMIHTDEQLFKDHTEFRPQRFIENNGLEKNLIPFGIGKRACLGESLARAELYLILGNLLLNYNLEPVDGFVPEMKSICPFGVSKRPPIFDIRFVPVSK